MSARPAITAADLAARVGGILEGDGARLLRGVAPLEHADANMVSWAATADFLSRVATSRAGVVLVPNECEVPRGRSVIRVADPDLAMCTALECLAHPADRTDPGVHSTAVVSTDARVEGAAIGAHVFIGRAAVIGDGTQLFPGVYIGAEVKIGTNCTLWPNVVVRERVTIGDRVVIHPNATIGADGFGYLQRAGKHHKIPQIGTVVIEDDVEIGAGTTIDRARSGITRVGRGTKIDNLVQIAHNVDVGNDCIIIAQSCVGGSSSLGHHVLIAGQSGVSDHRHVGSGAQIAAKSTVMRNVPDGQVIRGIPGTDNHRFLREQASLRKLPEWIRRCRALLERVERLESQMRDES
ncbi:MAG: UDP-3-O-(3-hydroxymyristoyl)glucosamine N-acyltransferase [Phycisphaerae bacterium]